MASGSLLGSIFTLASLPRPFDSAHGRTQAAPVFALSESKRTKRPEVVTSIDGESVNIYNVSNSALIATYAVPPQTRFVAAPCSLYQKHGKNQSARRYTYTAIQNRSNKLQIACFDEELQRAETSKPKTTFKDLPSTSAVASIRVVPSYSFVNGREDSHDVIVIQEDGKTSCFSAALQDLLWQRDVKELVSVDGAEAVDTLNVVFADITDVRAAKKGLLQGREDVLAQLDAGDARTAEHTQILFVATQASGSSSDCPNVHVFAVRPRLSTTGQVSVPQHLLTWHIPANRLASPFAQTDSYFLQPASGHFYHLAGESIVTYDLTGLSPVITSELQSDTSSFGSFVRISSSLLLTASSTEYSVYDVKYGTVQATQRVSREPAVTGKKRKHADIDSTTPPKLVSYFAKLGIAVALFERNLVAVQIGDNVSGSKAQAKGITLADSLGKGTRWAPAVSFRGEPIEPFANVLRDSTVLRTDEPSAWKTAAENLERLARSEDIMGFDRAFAPEVGVHVHANAKTPKKAEEQEELVEWTFPGERSTKLLGLFREKALFALRQIFQPSRPTSSDKLNAAPVSLRIQFYPPNVFHWLVRTGQLTSRLAGQALRVEAGNEQLNLQPGAVVTAIVDYDPSLELLYTTLQAHPHLEIDDLVRTVQVIIQSLNNSTLSLSDATLAATALALNNDDDVANGVIEPEADAAMADLDHAVEVLETGLPLRGESLRYALTKLNAFPVPQIVKALQTGLARQEIVFLIHILRIELADGGWTARYIDVGPVGAESGEPSDRAITVIAKLLSCAVDAFGVNGWLVASSADPADALDEVLVSLRTEITAALEGIHEASFMQGLLVDFLRFAHENGPTLRQKKKQKKERTLLPQTVEAEAENPVLPLGLKVPEGVADTTVDVTGKVLKKSKRQMGLELSMRVGQYSFERIRF
ncbi:hypothetical protein EJ06DRAFT_496423 [Trichodelitschia bisporula]|uniref:Utp8 beta-propeller domain-containing protein n=1 Tax=Trichodelitschia bisporula TaxID=703511 RepID=A0A6G1HRM0_9PEZI|nr:hypothetical protein EJ06DRAFT_496423 [Trichodelitschia bisporula]